MATTTVSPVQNDLATDAQNAVDAIFTAADNVLNGTENEVAKLDGDAYDFAVNTIDNVFPAPVRGILAGFLGAGASAGRAAAIAALSNVEKAYIQQGRNLLAAAHAATDKDLAADGATEPPPVS